MSRQVLAKRRACSSTVSTARLQVGGAVLVEDALDQVAQVGLYAFLERPVDAGILTHDIDQLADNEAQLLVAHHLYGAVAGPERVVKR